MKVVGMAKEVTLWRAEGWDRGPTFTPRCPWEKDAPGDSYIQIVSVRIRGPRLWRSRCSTVVTVQRMLYSEALPLTSGWESQCRGDGAQGQRKTLRPISYDLKRRGQCALMRFPWRDHGPGGKGLFLAAIFVTSRVYVGQPQPAGHHRIQVNVRAIGGE